MGTPQNGKRNRDQRSPDDSTELSPNLPFAKMANLNVSEERMMELMGTTMNKILDERLQPFQDSMKNTVDELRKTVASLQTQIQGYQLERQGLISNNNWLKEKLGEVLDKLENVENRSRRNNIVFTGIPEKENGTESEKDLRHTISDFCQQKLGVLGVLNNQQRTHRIGQRKQNAKFPRRIIALMPDNICQSTIFEKTNKLKGTNFGIDRDYTERVRCLRRAFFSFRKKVFGLGLRVRVVYDHFFLNDFCFYVGKNSSVLLCNEDLAGYALQQMRGVNVDQVLGIWNEVSHIIENNSYCVERGWTNLLASTSTSFPPPAGNIPPLLTPDELNIAQNPHKSSQPLMPLIEPCPTQDGINEPFE